MNRLREKESGFTLIELLAVIAIMAILLVAAVPAYNSFKQKGLQGPVTQLMGTLRLARQYAITHRQYVYVVFPDDSDTYSPPIEVEKAFRSYAVLAMTNQTPAGFQYVTDWKYLPKGVVFYDPDDVSAKANIIFHKNTVSPIKFPFPSDDTSFAIKHRIMPAVLFKPNGRAYRYMGNVWSDNAVQTDIIPTEGMVFVDTGAGNVLSVTNLLGANALTYPIRVFNKTGQIDYKRTRT